MKAAWQIMVVNCENCMEHICQLFRENSRVLMYNLAVRIVTVVPSKLRSVYCNLSPACNIRRIFDHRIFRYFIGLSEKGCYISYGFFTVEEKQRVLCQAVPELLKIKCILSQRS